MTALRHVEVERVNQDRIEIRWELVGQQGLVSIYEGSTPDEIDTATIVAQTSGESVVLLRPRREGRRYFKVVPEGDDGRVVSERVLAFEGISNFRDLGGYETASGQTVKWGRIYRSGDLSEATEADLAYLSRLGIRVILDIRHPEDISEYPDRLPSSDTRLLVLGIGSEEVSHVMEVFQRADSKAVVETEGRRAFSQVYRSFVSDYPDRFAVIFRVLADRKNIPALFHCASGQDRTGLAAAILLMLLGVPYGTVVADYMLSNRHKAGGLADLIAQHPHPAAVESFFDVQEEYLEAGIGEIRRRYGSLERYAIDGLGMTSGMVARLRSLLLCP